MSTKTEQSQARAEERRWHKHAKADRRRRDRALVPGVVAQRVGIPVADLARAMRAAGVCRQLTEVEANEWISGPETAPDWFTTLVGERLARAAEAEYRREQAEEQRQLHELAVEQSAWAKVQAGKRRFSDDELVFVHDWAFRAAKDLVRSGPDAGVSDGDRRVLLVVGVDAEDHSTWPVHAGGCDGEGEQQCARVGMVVKVNKVTVKVRLIGGRGDRYAVVEKNLDPRYVRIASSSLSCPPTPGEVMLLRDHGGRTRQARVVAVDGPLFEATYSLKSGEWRSAWFDLTAIEPEGAHREPVA
jgi:hypothetical protein